VLAGIIRAHTKFATALIQIKRADLENSLVLARVEVAKVDLVLEEFVKVSMKAGALRSKQIWL